MAEEIPVSEARAQFAELINRVGYGGEHVVITRHGKPLVALVPVAAEQQDRPADDQAGVIDLSSARLEIDTPQSAPRSVDRPAARHDR